MHPLLVAVIFKTSDTAPAMEFRMRSGRTYVWQNAQMVYSGGRVQGIFLGRDGMSSLFLSVADIEAINVIHDLDVYRSGRASPGTETNVTL